MSIFLTIYRTVSKAINQQVCGGALLVLEQSNVISIKWNIPFPPGMQKAGCPVVAR